MSAAAAVLLVVLSHVASAQGVVSGTVRDSAGVALPNAAATIDPLSRRATSDRDGRFVFNDIPSGTHLLTIRAIGYLPAVAAVSISGDERKQVVMTLVRAPQSLDTVVVKDKARLAGIGLAAFEERRARGFGKFIDLQELQKNEHRNLPDMLASIPGVMLVKPRRCKSPPMLNDRCDSNASKRIAMRGRGQPCAMQVVLDGTIVFRGDGRPVSDAEFDWEGAWDLGATSLSELAGVEVYRSAGEVPGEFGGAAAGCGVILLWTRK